MILSDSKVCIILISAIMILWGVKHYKYFKDTSNNLFEVSLKYFKAVPCEGDLNDCFCMISGQIPDENRSN